MSRHRDLFPSALTIPSSSCHHFKEELVFYKSYKFSTNWLNKTSIRSDQIGTSRYGVLNTFMIRVYLGIALKLLRLKRGSPILTSKFYILMHSLNAFL